MLHILTEDLAAFLSEVTQGDLECAVPCSAQDVGDLYLHLVEQNLNVATALTDDAGPHEQWIGPTDRTFLGASADPIYGGAGLEIGYRSSAGLMENAFAAVTDTSRLCQPKGAEAEIDVATLYEEQISKVVIHTWDIAQALGLPYQPAPDVTQRILRTTLLRTAAVDDADAFARVLTLSKRAC